ncbi:MAG TPA: trans-aconitate 2-methyltransferase [Rhizomicrobium sp.]|jgi:trans-aconitate 2-methyltransferase
MAYMAGMTWNPTSYLAFASERTRPAAELLARIPLETPQAVADVGCGPGNSTALLVERWPHADVEGLDSSPDMIAEAEASGVVAHWTLTDAATWTAERAFDVMFSNAAYQWMPDHRALLPRLLKFVKRGGAFAFQVPCNFNAPSHVLMRETANDGPWAAKLQNIREASVLGVADYFDILEPHAARIDIWETEYLQVLEGEDAVYRWVSATGLRPFVQALEGAEREAFIAAYKTRLNAAYPLRADGRTLFPFQRLFAVALR